MSTSRVLISVLAAIGINLAAAGWAGAQDNEPPAEVAGVVDSINCLDGLQQVTVNAEDVLQQGGGLKATDGALTVYVAQRDSGPQTPLRFFDFSALSPVHSVVVSGTEVLRFEFNPATIEASQLHAGATDEGLPQDIQTINFCY